MSLNNRTATIKANFLNGHKMYKCSVVYWKYNMCEQCNLRFKCLTTAEDDIIEVDINKTTSESNPIFLLEQAMFNHTLNLENLAKTNIREDRYGLSTHR